MPPVLVRYAELHPEVELAARSGGPADVLDALTSGRLDCAAVPDSGRPQLEGFSCTSLLRDAVGLTMSAQHPLARQAELTVEDLAGYRILCWDRPHGYWGVIKAALQRSGLQMGQLLSVESQEAMRELTRQDSGVAFFPRIVVARGIGRGEFVFRPVRFRSGSPYELTTWFCFSRKHLLVRELSDLRDVFRVCAADLESQLHAGHDAGCLQLTS
jgi:DNA-binding transcriptional LysR family regulator